MEPSSKNKSAIFIILAILVLSGLALFAGKMDKTDQPLAPSVTSTPVSQLPSEADRVADITAIRSFMGDENYAVNYAGSGLASDFFVAPVGSFAKGKNISDSTIPDEWKKVVNRYHSIQTIGANCDVYLFEVFPKTHDVVHVRIEKSPTGQTNCPVNASLGADGINKPELSEAHLKEIGNGFLTRSSTPYYPTIKYDVKVSLAGKDGNEPPTYEWYWQDTSYILPQGLDAMPKGPTLSFYVASAGVLLNYQNTIPLFTDNGVSSYRASLTGTYTSCIPRHDNFGDQSCRVGMKTDDGSYYLLDFNQMSVEKPTLKEGSRFTATGKLTPIELLSSIQNSVARGIFSVTDSVKVQ